MTPPCKFDHNGECLICDCWPSDCQFNKLSNKEFFEKYNSEIKYGSWAPHEIENLKKLFLKPYFTKHLIDDNGETKLFVCNRDIEVVGEVSPEAIWVKEGMTFDYGEIRQYYACEKGSECDINFGEQLCSAPHQVKLPIMFQCPTCKTFK